MSEINIEHDDFKELENVLRLLKTHFLVFDFGNLNSNIINQIGKMESSGVKLITMDKSPIKINVDDIQLIIRDSDIVIIIADLGEDNARESAQMVAEVAKDIGILTVVFAIIPSSHEDEERYVIATNEFLNLRHIADTIITIPTDEILETFIEFTHQHVKEYQSEMLIKLIQSIVGAIKEPGIVNIDFADIRSFTEKKGKLSNIGFIGYGESSGENNALNAAQNVIANPLFGFNKSDDISVLLNIRTGSEVIIDDVETTVEKVYNNINQESRLIWGCAVDDNLTSDTIQVSVLAVSNEKINVL